MVNNMGQNGPSLRYTYVLYFLRVRPIVNCRKNKSALRLQHGSKIRNNLSFDLIGFCIYVDYVYDFVRVLLDFLDHVYKYIDLGFCSTVCVCWK